MFSTTVRRISDQGPKLHRARKRIRNSMESIIFFIVLHTAPPDGRVEHVLPVDDSAIRGPRA